MTQDHRVQATFHSLYLLSIEVNHTPIDTAADMSGHANVDLGDVQKNTLVTWFARNRREGLTGTSSVCMLLL